MRGKGLGRVLTEAIFAQALEHGIEKMVAQMTIDQKGAIATFEELGFRPEALLRDHVKDRYGEKHDLLVYSHDVRRVPVAARCVRGDGSGERRLATYPQRGSNSIGISSAVLPMSSRATSFVMGWKGPGRTSR